MGAMTIAGQITDGDWSVTGPAGAISAAVIANAWNAAFDNRDIKSITTKTDLNNATLRLTQPVDPANAKKLGLGKLAVGGWIGRNALGWVESLMLAGFSPSSPSP